MPAQATYEPIATMNGTGTTGGEVISFTSIPQTYTDLVVVANLLLTTASGSNTITMSVNTGTGSAYSGTVVLSNGASALSSRQTATTVWYPQSAGYSLSSTITTPMVMHIGNYANTTTFKPVVTRVAADRNGSGITALHVGQFLSTAAINRITFSSNEANNFWTTSTMFTLYGIKAA